MNRKSLFGRFAAPISARRTAQRPKHHRAQLEPLEDRKLLAIINVDDNWRLVGVGIGTTVTLTFGADVISDQNSAPNNNKTGTYGITAFGTVANGTSELTGQHFLTVADDIDGIDNDTRFIQDAINRAVDDDTVNILPGTYTESDIFVTKPLRLRGSGFNPAFPSTDTLLVPEVFSTKVEEEFGDNTHSGIFIYAPSVTVSLLRLDGSGNAGLSGTYNYHQGITTLYDQQKNPTAYHDYLPTRGRAPVTPKRLGTYGDGSQNTAPEGTNPNRSRPRIVIKDVRVDNIWYHGVVLSAMSGQHFNVGGGGAQDDVLQNQVYNVIVNNVGDPGNRGANHIGVLLQNLQNHPDTTDGVPSSNTNIVGGTGLLVSNVGIGVSARAYAGFYGSVSYDSDAGARLDITIWNVTVNSAQVEGIRLQNNSGGDGIVSNVLNFDPGNSAIGVHYIHSEALPLAATTITNAFIGVKIEDSDTQTKLTTPGGNTNPNGRNAVPVLAIGLKIIGETSPVAGSVGLLADNGGAFGGVNTDAGFILSLEVDISRYDTGVKVLQSAASNRSTFVAIDRPKVHDNNVAYNIGAGVIVQGVFSTTNSVIDPGTILSPAYYPNLIENYADQLDDQPVPPTQPIAANVTPPPPIVSVESKPRPAIIETGNLTLGADTLYNPILNGTAGQQSIILEGFSVARTLTILDVVSTDQVNPWRVNFVDDDPNLPIYYKTPAVLGLWNPLSIVQSGTGVGTIVLESTTPFGAIYDANATAPLDVSSYNNLRIIARRGPNVANGVKQVAIGVVDQDGTADVFFIPTSRLEAQWAIDTSVFVTFDVNLLTPPIRFTDGDGIMNLSAVTGWAAAGDLAFTDFKTVNDISIEIDSIGFSKGAASGTGTGSSASSQMKVTGTVTLGAGVATLDPASGGQYVSSVGQKFVIIDNDGTDAVSGTFKDVNGNNLTEGALFTSHGRHFSISYKGIDGSTGNDVVLTEASANAAPVLDLDVANGASTGFTTSWSQGAAAVNLTNTDAIVTDADDLTLDKMTATLTTAQPHLSQTISLTGVPAGGNFTLTYDGKTTAPLRYNTTASAVQSALEGLSTIGAGNVTVVTDPDAQHVTGSPGGPWTVTLGGALNLATLKKIKGNAINLPSRRLTLRGAPTGGTFTLTYRGQTTSAIAWDAPATGVGSVQTALQALSTIGGGNMTVTGSAGGPWTMTFGGTMDLTNLDVLIPNSSGLTGGSSPKGNVEDIDALNGGTAPSIRVLDGGVHPGDRLTATATGSIVVEYNTTSGILKMTGTDTKANYQTVLRSIKYNSVSHPVAGTRTIKIVANDGADNSNTVTATVTITANALPVLDLDGPGGTNDFAVTRTHNAVPGGIVDSDATVTDSDSANVSSAAARVTAAHPHIAQVIKLIGTPAASQTSVPTGGTFVLKYNGKTTGDIAYNASAATLQTALEGLSTIGGGNVTVSGANGGPWIAVFGGALDTTNLGKLSAKNLNTDGSNQLTGGAKPTVQILDTPPHMTQVITSTGTGGTFALKYKGESTVAIAFNASATTVQTAIRNLSTVGTTNAFVTGANGGPWTVVFGGPLSSTTPISPNPAIFDLDGLASLVPDNANLTGGTASVAQAEAGVEVYPGDALAVTTLVGGVTQSYNATTGILTLSGTTTKANYETILRSLTYNSTAISPPAGSRLVKISLKDAVLGETVDPYTTINIIANELPFADLNGPTNSGTGYTSTWSRVTSAVNITTFDATLNDSDDTTLVGMTAKFNAAPHAGDVLAATATGLISVSYNSTTGVLTMSGTDTVANYQTVLQSITYNNTNNVSGPIPPVASKRINVVADDGKNTSLVTIATVTITANAKPILDLDAGGPTSHTSLWVTPTTIFITDVSGATVFDADAENIASMTATLVSPQAGDVLGATATGLISVSYNATTGVLSMTGSDTQANYQTVLRSITYNNTIGVPSAATKTVNITATDAFSPGATSTAVQALITIDKLPIADLDQGAPTNWTSNWSGTAVIITDATPGFTSGAAVVDADDGKVGSMTATLTTLHTGDVLTATPQAGITVSYNATTGVLSMTGVASKILYKAVLKSITYNNTVAAPPVATKTVNIKAIDPHAGVGPNSVATINIAGGGVTTVAGRHIFYNQSAYDGVSPASAAINFVSDELARAPDKTAYRPGDPIAVAFNVTNYSRGINGIMVDLSTTGGVHQSITASDFVFKVGNNNTPSSWAAAPAPLSVAVSLGGGISGSDRVEITWTTGTIVNKWLEVQVLANATTGLAATDVFFWGNRIGDTAQGTLNASNFQTTTTDGAQVNAQLVAVPTATITNPRDFNRDKGVTTTDGAIVNANLGNTIRLLVGTAGPFAPEGGGGGGAGDAGISSALAGGGGGGSASAASQALPAAIVERLASGGGGTSAAVDAALASSADDDAAAADEDASDLDELLDSLAAGL